MLRIHDLVVKEAHLTVIYFAIGGTRISIVAPEEEGKRIATRLRELEGEHALEYDAQNERGERQTGLCDIKELKIEEDTSKTPVIYRISCLLQIIG